MGRDIAIVPITTGVLHNTPITLMGPDWMDNLHAKGIFPIFANFDLGCVNVLDTTNATSLSYVKEVFKNMFGFEINIGIDDTVKVIVACDEC